MNPFRRSTAAWHSVGLASDLPDLDEDGQRVAPKCKAFTIPTNGAVERVEDIDLPGELKDQVLVFRYKGKYHAIDHVSLAPAAPGSCGRDSRFVAMPALVLPSVAGTSL